jgi:hypothetical protein
VKVADLSLLTTQSVAAARERSFFKYVSRETAKAVLSNNTLRWSSPILFNDPFDIQFDLRVEVNRRVVKSKALRLQWQVIHSDEPARNGNILGKAITAYRSTLRKLSSFIRKRLIGLTKKSGIFGLEEEGQRMMDMKICPLIQTN